MCESIGFGVFQSCGNWNKGNVGGCGSLMSVSVVSLDCLCRWQVHCILGAPSVPFC